MVYRVVASLWFRQHHLQNYPVGNTSTGNKEKTNNRTIHTYMHNNMDVAITQLQNYVTNGDSSTIDAAMTLLQQIKVARITGIPQPIADEMYVQALECGVFLSIQLEDLDTFTRHIQQLQPFYTTTTTTTTSPLKNHIIGLNLMSLLVTASSSEFHSELELLDPTMITDPFIQFPIAIERKFMVGIYDEILTMQVPHVSYQFFMNQLVTTVRDAIADCIEVSYTSLSIQQTAERMKFDVVSEIQDLLDYIEVSREDWIIDNDRIIFQPPTTTTMTTSSTTNGGNTISSVTGQDVPSQQWIQQALTYATEMERII